ncbi:MAG: MarR family winged helix-turn-helix transcriptional regulator, partial [Chloroflexota bacterium]
ATPPSAPPQEETDARAAVLALMMEMQRGMMSRLDGRAAREWLKLELTTAQLKLLMWLVGVREQPMSQLARVLGIGLPAATNLVDKLVDAGLVTREHSPVDRRVVLVRPSPEGEVQITRLRQVGRDQMRRILAHVPDDDLPTLAAGTRIILEAARRAAAAAQHHTAELDAPR